MDGSSVTSGAFTASSSATWLGVDKATGTAPTQLVVRTNVFGTG